MADGVPSVELFLFVGNTVDIIVLLSSKFLNVIGFTGVLWSIAPELVFFLIAYSTFGTLVTVKGFGSRLMSLKFQALQREANFRYSLVRVRDNVVSIAFYGGESHEVATIKTFLATMVANIRELILWNRHLSLFNNVCNLVLFPKLVLHFTGFWLLFQSSYSSLIVSVALQRNRKTGKPPFSSRRSYWGRAVNEASIWPNSSTVDNDREETPLLNMVPEAVPSGTILREVGPGLVLNYLSIATPNSQILYHSLNLELAPGESLLVMGPSGCGNPHCFAQSPVYGAEGMASCRVRPVQTLSFCPKSPTCRWALYVTNSSSQSLRATRTPPATTTTRICTRR